jgi:DNA-binding response OmpR family regulator
MVQQPARILVVADEAVLRFTLKLLLQRSGYMVTTAADGPEALDLIQRQRFNLLLLDRIVLGLNGVPLARQAHELQPATAILILTESETPEHGPDDPAPDGLDVVYTSASPQEILARIAAALTDC